MANLSLQSLFCVKKVKFLCCLSHLRTDGVIFQVLSLKSRRTIINVSDKSFVAICVQPPL